MVGFPVYPIAWQNGCLMTEKRPSKLPIFPLQTVLFPGGILNLRIFEPRYLQMIRDCAAQGQPFGVCLMLSDDSGESAAPATVGTTAFIEDFYTMEGGLLGIKARGVDRFRAGQGNIRDDGLLVSEVEYLEAAEPVTLATEFSILRTILERVIEQDGSLLPETNEDLLEDAGWISYRLAELLPFHLRDRQILLALTEPEERLDVIMRALPEFQSD